MLQSQPRTAGWRPPAVGWFALAFVATVILGQLSMDSTGSPGIWLIAGAALPPLAAVSLAAGRLDERVRLRKLALALAIGGLLSTTLAILLHIAVGALVWTLVQPLRDAVEDLATADGVNELLRSPGVLIALVDFAVVAPLVEELTKPLAVLLLASRIRTRNEAFLVGMAGGAGFAFVENLLYEGGAYSSLWTAVTVLRSAGAALHPLTAGLVGIGVWELTQRRPGSGLRLLGYLGVAVGLHAAWNGGLVILESIEADYLFEAHAWQLNVYGLWLPGIMITFLGVMGVGLWVLLFLVGGQLRSPDARPSEPLLALHLERPERLALTGAALLAAVVPIGALWGPLVARQLEIALANG